MEHLYFGTYTRRASEGIYRADFDPETGRLSNLHVWAKEANPTYLAVAADGVHYTVGSKDGQGGIAAYTATAHLLNHVVEEGAPLCYVAVDPHRPLVYGANYHKGQVLVYKRAADGSLSLADSRTHTGNGPHENQASPHVHFADLTPDQYLVTCDLGTDEVITYAVSDQGSLTEVARYHSAAGAGPRHIVFHPHQKIAYLICELNSTIEVLIYDGVGQFEHLQTLSTIPADHTDFNGTAAIRITRDGQFVYGSNRGHDSIAVYQVQKDGQLALLEIVPTNGKTPRDFTLSPDERHVIVAHQDSDTVTVFSRDAASGRLTELSHDFIVPEAVCTLFA